MQILTEIALNSTYTKAKVTNLQKIFISRILSASFFWMAILTFYLEKRGLSLAEVYQLLSIYYLSVILFEFPTGVIGDHFSHRKSVLLGYSILALSSFAMALEGEFTYYILIFVLSGFGVALTSGSDTALLIANSKDIKSDLSRLKIYCVLAMFLAVSVSSLMTDIMLTSTFILTGIFYIFAFLLIFFVSEDKVRTHEANIFQTAFAAIGSVKQNRALLNTILISSLLGMFSFSIKWFYNPMFEELSIPLRYWGVITGITFLLPIIGIKLYQKVSRNSFLISGGIFAFSIIFFGVTSTAIIPLAFLLIHSISRGYIETVSEVKIGDLTDEGHRASILSLNNLSIRLLSSIYTPMAGYIIDKGTLLQLSIGTGVTIFILIAVPAYLLDRKSNTIKSLQII